MGIMGAGDKMGMIGNYIAILFLALLNVVLFLSLSPVHGLWLALAIVLALSLVVIKEASISKGITGILLTLSALCVFSNIFAYSIRGNLLVIGSRAAGIVFLVAAAAIIIARSYRRIFRLSKSCGMPEVLGLILTCFFFGAFAAILPVYILPILHLSGHLPLSHFPLKSFCYLAAINGVLFLIAGLYWYEKYHVTGITVNSVLHASLLWGIASILSVILLGCIPYSILLIIRPTGELIEGMGFTAIYLMNLIPFEYAYGCLVGVLASLLLQMKLKGIWAIAFLSGFILIASKEYDKTKYTIEEVDKNIMIKLAQSNKIDELIKYLGHDYEYVRTSAAQAIQGMSPDISLPALQTEFQKKPETRQDKDRKIIIIGVLEKINDDRTIDVLKQAYLTSDDNYVKRCILVSLREKKVGNSMVPFYAKLLDNSDQDTVGEAVQGLFKITHYQMRIENAGRMSYSELISQEAKNFKDWWEQNKANYAE
jgi:hypothetical protein